MQYQSEEDTPLISIKDAETWVILNDSEREV